MTKIFWGKNFQLLLMLGVATLYWLMVPSSHSFSDPAKYLNLAIDFDNISSWEMEHPFDHRIGLLVLHWLSFKLFGINDFASFLPSLLTFYVMVIAVHVFCDDGRQLFFANVLMVGLLQYSKNIYPDLGASAFMLLSLYFMANGSQASSGIKVVIFGAIAFLFKEVAYFLIFPFLFIFLSDCYTRKIANKLKFYGALMISGSIFFILYFGMYEYLWSDALARLSALSFDHLWKQSTAIDTVVRIIFEPIREFPLHVSALFWPVVIFSVYWLLNPEKKENRKFTILNIALVSWVLVFTFGSTSLYSYQPLPFVERMLFPIIIVFLPIFGYAIVNIAQDVNQVIGSKKTYFLTTLIAGLCLISSVEKSASYAYRMSMSGDLHNARKFVANRMAENNLLQLHTAEARTTDNLRIFNGGINIDKSRMHVCDFESLRYHKKSTKLLIFIDYSLANFLADYYDFELCYEELREALPPATEIVYDSESVFLATIN